MDIKVHLFRSDAPASVNSYWLETANGIVIIDAQRQISNAAKKIEQIKQTGKPVLGIFLTHGHPDHIGGLNLLYETYPDVPIYTLQGIQEDVDKDLSGFQKQSFDQLNGDFPNKLSVPFTLVFDKDVISLDGAEIEVQDIGAGESMAMAMFYLSQQNILISGDIVQYEMTPFLIEGRSKAWLLQLDKAIEQYPEDTMIYPGHGVSGTAAVLFNWQKEQILMIRRLIIEHSVDGTLTEEKMKTIIRLVEEKFPRKDKVALIDGLEALNAEAVLKEMTEKFAVAETV